MRVGAPDELSAVLLADRLGRDRCRIGQQSDDSWYLEFNRPPTPGPAAELLAEVRRWLAEAAAESAGATIALGHRAADGGQVAALFLLELDAQGVVGAFDDQPVRRHARAWPDEDDLAHGEGGVRVIALVQRRLSTGGDADVRRIHLVAENRGTGGKMRAGRCAARVLIF